MYAVEPSQVAMRLAEPRIAVSPATVIQAGLTGEHLDLPSEEFDAILSTWTLCTIPDMGVALDETRARVLKPGGSFHFVEHGHAPDAGIARWQQRIEPLHKRLFGGCHLTRRIAETIERAGFTIEHLDTYYRRAPRNPSATCSKDAPASAERARTVRSTPMTSRVVLITGCSSGIGLETALAFARRGDTTVASMRNLAKADALMSRAKDEDLSIDLVQLDVVDDASVTAAVADVEKRHGPIDVLVNNAGVGYDGPIETIDFERARAVLEANLWGPVRVIRAALPAMRERGSGVIVNVSSVAARVPATAYQSFYAASKHGTNAVSEALSREVDQFGVRVVCIEPGFFATDIVANADEGANRGGTVRRRPRVGARVLP